MIGSGDAAEIPVPLKGRGYARLGPRQLVPFQAAFCGAPLTSDTDEAPVLVAPFVHTDDSPKVAGASVPEHGTQLAAVLGAIRTRERDARAPARRLARGATCCPSG